MSAAIRIPFNRPGLAGPELEWVRDAILGGHTSGDGPFTRRCRALLEELLEGPRVLLTTSCTHALELAAVLLDLAPGDEVVVPSFTFVSTANAFALHGARVVFADVREDTLCLDEERLAERLTPRTRAVVPVHYAGVGCAMDAIGALAAARGIDVVEDDAHGLLGRYQGRPLGSFGRFATLSFHETKNFHCGEGGALLLNDPADLSRAEVLREKGTDRSKFFRGEVDKYTWVDVGSSWLPSDMLAAFLLAQLEGREAILAKRRAVWERYRDGLADWAEEVGARLPVVPADCEQSYHMFYVLLPDAAARDALLRELRAQGILAVFHYLPLHLSPMGRRFGGREGDCPVTEDVSGRLLRLPFYNDLEPLRQDEVIAAVRRFRPR